MACPRTVHTYDERIEAHNKYAIYLADYNNKINSLVTWPKFYPAQK